MQISQSFTKRLVLYQKVARRDTRSPQKARRNTANDPLSRPESHTVILPVPIFHYNAAQASLFEISPPTSLESIY